MQFEMVNADVDKAVNLRFFDIPPLVKEQHFFDGHHYLCLEKMGKPCPMCFVYKQLWRMIESSQDQPTSEALKLIVRRFKPITRWYWAVANRSVEPPKVQILAASKELYSCIADGASKIVEEVEFKRWPETVWEWLRFAATFRWPTYMRNYGVFDVTYGRDFLLWKTMRFLCDSDVTPTIPTFQNSQFVPNASLGLPELAGTVHWLWDKFKKVEDGVATQEDARKMLWERLQVDLPAVDDELRAKLANELFSSVMTKEGTYAYDVAIGLNEDGSADMDVNKAFHLVALAANNKYFVDCTDSYVQYYHNDASMESLFMRVTYSPTLQRIVVHFPELTEEAEELARNIGTMRALTLANQEIKHFFTDASGKKIESLWGDTLNTCGTTIQTAKREERLLEEIREQKAERKRPMSFDSLTGIYYTPDSSLPHIL